MVAVAELERGATRGVIQDTLDAIGCMEHRGGCLEDTGDGAGLLFEPERAFFEPFLTRRLDAGERLVVGTVFFLRGERNVRELEREVDTLLRQEGLAPLGWRRVPTDPSAVGVRAREDLPRIRQVFVGRGHRREGDLSEALRQVRARIENVLGGQLAVPSLSARVTVYKALSTSAQLPRFYPDLLDPNLRSRVALGHRRFATNTFSNWHLVQPFRLLAHNGEINTISANTRAVRDAERLLGGQNVLLRHGSDSSHLDRAMEFLAAKRLGSLPEAMRLLIPPSWTELDLDARGRRYFESAQRVLGTLGAWEGPAGLVATDGEFLVAQLDRMGLRPLRYAVSDTGRVVIGSEMGALDWPFESIVADGQLEPGAQLIVDLDAGELIPPERSLEWITQRTQLPVTGMGTTELLPARSDGDAEIPVQALNTFGWNRERAKKLRDTARAGKEPVHSMGNDRPLAIYSENHSRLYSYLNQIVAVVTNPAIDPLREGEAMDTTVYLGRSPRLDTKGTEGFGAQYQLPHPVLTNEDLRALKAETHSQLHAHVLDATFTDTGHHSALTERLHALTDEAEAVTRAGHAAVLIISDRAVIEGERLPIPALFVVGAVHRRLALLGLRRDTSLVVETGGVHESHDLAVLIAYGATAVNPFAMFHLAKSAPKVEASVARGHLVKSLVSGLRRIMSKMGVCTIAGYRGSVLFEAIGLAPEVVDYYLPRTHTRIGGMRIPDIYAAIVARSKGSAARLERNKNVAVYRKAVTTALQLVARNGNAQGDYDTFLNLLEETPPVYLRDLLRFKTRRPIPVQSVVSAETVVARVLRGAAMSHGALHSTAHRAIAAAFNALGSFSNSGEGGEDSRRNPGGPWAVDRNKVRQIASGRFGVDAAYLMGAEEIEIKIGQGAKPGEGGHLPGNKVTAEIAAIRKTREGVDLISPPPHHDIYSIEDLAQLIRHLRAVNPAARIGVKVPSVSNLGTIAVGVAKAGADVISVSGCEGGTGAAASGSILHAGLPLELGLSDAHQYLLANGVRDRVRLRADGGIKCGADVCKVLALGADEIAMGTPLMVAENCVFCRGCQNGNCPVGLATQNTERMEQKFMRKHREGLITVDSDFDARYVEAREGVKRYLICLAQDIRRILARLGLERPAELTGRVDLLEQIASDDSRWTRVDLSELLLDFRDQSTAPRQTQAPGSGRISQANQAILDGAKALLEGTEQTAFIELDLSTQDHAVGATLAGKIAVMGGLAEGQIVRIRARGYSGQGFGYAATSGMILRLEGYANDVVGEVMSGNAQIVVVPPQQTERRVHLAGNTIGYGATGGELWIAGLVGQRFGVRNSGTIMICEGAGKYAFEYMTGGVGVVLGECGQAIGSGMTGGRLYLYDPDGLTRSRLSADTRVLPMAEAERDTLRALLVRYTKATQSPVARRLVKDWSNAASAFLMVEAA